MEFFSSDLVVDTISQPTAELRAAALREFALPTSTADRISKICLPFIVLATKTLLPGETANASHMKRKHSEDVILVDSKRPRSDINNGFFKLNKGSTEMDLYAMTRKFRLDSKRLRYFLAQPELADVDFLPLQQTETLSNSLLPDDGSVDRLREEH
jgi:hypothetical protein